MVILYYEMVNLTRALLCRCAVNSSENFATTLGVSELEGKYIIAYFPRESGPLTLYFPREVIFWSGAHLLYQFITDCIDMLVRIILKLSSLLYFLIVMKRVENNREILHFKFKVHVNLMR